MYLGALCLIIFIRVGFFNLLKSTCMQINRTRWQSWWMSIFLQNTMHTNMTLLLWWGENCSSVYKSDKVPWSNSLCSPNPWNGIEDRFLNVAISQTTTLSSHLCLLRPAGSSAVAYAENIHHWLTRKIMLMHFLHPERKMTTKDCFNSVFSFLAAECC